MALVPKHLEVMRQLTGTHEYPGDADNPVILQWPGAIADRFPRMSLYCALYKHDSTAWCGLTVAYCMALAGIEPPYHPSIDTQSFLWAAAWRNWGRAVTGAPEPGDVVVFDHHVTLYERTEGNNYICRGGNQSDQVKESAYAISSVVAIRRPVMATLASTTARYHDITATVFGGAADRQTSAYDGHLISDDELGVALPFRFGKGDRPKVRVTAGGRSCVCSIVDVGPWNTDDPYWTLGRRPQAESGTDHSGRRTNGAGIDLTPAAAKAIGLDGKGKVDWEFVTAAAVAPTPSAPAPGRVVTLNLDALETLLALVVLLVKKEHGMSETSPAPGAPPDVLHGLQAIVPLLVKLLEAKAPTPIVIPTPTPAPAPVSTEPPTAPPATPPAKSKFGFGTGIIGTLIASVLHQQGVIAAPVGEGSSLVGLLSFVVPIAVSVFGSGGGFGALAAALVKALVKQKLAGR